MRQNIDFVHRSISSESDFSTGNVLCFGPEYKILIERRDIEPNVHICALPSKPQIPPIGKKGLKERLMNGIKQPDGKRNERKK